MINIELIYYTTKKNTKVLLDNLDELKMEGKLLFQDEENSVKNGKLQSEKERR